MKHQIIQGCYSSKLRTHALSNPELTLADIVEKATIDENVKAQSELFKKPFESINSIKSIPPGFTTKREAFKRLDSFSNLQPFPQHNQQRVRFNQRSNHANWNIRKCFGCDEPYPHEDSPCPARGKLCSNCGKRNHFAKCCRQ